MTDNTLKIILLIAVILIALTFAYLLLRARMKRFLINKILSSSITIAHLKNFEKQKKDTRVFFFGACEFNSGIDARQFGNSTFNFSAQIASFPEQYYFLKHYIDEMPSLKLIVLSLGDNSFCSYASTGATFPLLFSRFIDYKELLSVSSPAMWFKLLWYKWLYSTDLGTLHYGRKYFSKWFKRFIREKKIGLGRMKQSVATRLSGAKNSNTQEAVSNERGTPAGQSVAPDNKPEKTGANPDDGAIGVKKHFTVPVFDKRAIFYFEKILSLCKEKNIPVVTVSMPRSKYFLELSKKHITEEIFLEKIVNNPEYKNLVLKHFNYLTIYRDRDDLFHPEGALLNAEGREAFSCRLAEDIRSIMGEIAKRRDSAIGRKI